MNIMSFYSSFSDDAENNEEQVRQELDSEMNEAQEISYPVEKEEPVELKQTPAFVFTDKFLKAGKAKFTVANPNGVHYTFQVKQIPNKNEFFVGVLTGPNNEQDYTYMAVLTERNTLRFTQKSGYKEGDLPSKVFNWAVKVGQGKAKLPEGYSIQHANHCGRCSRLLTDPVSISTGLGPECRNK